MRNGLAVFVLAIDRLDAVIETYGRELTDEILASCAARLAQLTETAVICEQLQNDRFVVVIADLLEQRDIERTFSNFLYVVGRAIASDGRSLHLTVRGGVSVFPVDGVTPHLLLQRPASALEEPPRRRRRGDGETPGPGK